MNYFQEIHAEARTVAEQIRTSLNGNTVISNLGFEQHGAQVAAVFWTGHHIERVILTVPVPTAQHIIKGGFDCTRLRWRYQDAVADALRFSN